MAAGRNRIPSLTAHPHEPDGRRKGDARASKCTAAIVEPRDVFKHHGIPCTKPERTVLDCAAGCGIEQLEEFLMALDSKRPRLDRRRLEQLVAENAGRRGIRNLRELTTDDPKDTDSENERRMLRICRRFGVPEFETQYPIKAGGNDYRADFCWPELQADRRVRLLALARRQAQDRGRPGAGSAADDRRLDRRSLHAEPDQAGAREVGRRLMSLVSALSRT